MTKEIEEIINIILNNLLDENEGIRWHDEKRKEQIKQLLGTLKRIQTIDLQKET